MEFRNPLTYGLYTRRWFNNALNEHQMSWRHNDNDDFYDQLQ